MEEYLKRSQELKESVEGNYEHSTNIQDYELVEWLIKQAETLQKIKELTEIKDMYLSDFAIEVLRIINKPEIPTRKPMV